MLGHQYSSCNRPRVPQCPGWPLWLWWSLQSLQRSPWLSGITIFPLKNKSPSCSLHSLSCPRRWAMFPFFNALKASTNEVSVQQVVWIREHKSMSTVLTTCSGSIIVMTGLSSFPWSDFLERASGMTSFDPSVYSSLTLNWDSNRCQHTCRGDSNWALL